MNVTLPVGSALGVEIPLVLLWCVVDRGLCVAIVFGQCTRFQRIKSHWLHSPHSLESNECDFARWKCSRSGNTVGVVVVCCGPRFVCSNSVWTMHTFPTDKVTLVAFTTLT